MWKWLCNLCFVSCVINDYHCFIITICLVYETFCKSSLVFIDLEYMYRNQRELFSFGVIYKISFMLRVVRRFLCNYYRGNITQLFTEYFRLLCIGVASTHFSNHQELFLLDKCYQLHVTAILLSAVFIDRSDTLWYYSPGALLFLFF